MLSKLLAVLGVGLLVSGTAVAAQRTSSTVTITSASVTAKWKESYVKGSVTLTISCPSATRKGCASLRIAVPG